MSDTQQEPGSVIMQRAFTHSGQIVRESEKSEPIHVRRFPSDVPVANITYGKGETINMGNYESIRIYVQISLPCPIEEIEQAYLAAEEFVAVKLEEETNSIRH